ncbi:SIS domain-containing protein [Paenibacillus albus]|uniref:SIS domain-containing protein n=1 Tax=Paenibacillus albus TaxID=2495582 RepID=UPI001D13095B|nr:SIS domain-containing protein [Paenibacillus albus]
MNAGAEYIDGILQLVEKLKANIEPLNQSAQLITDAIEAGRTLHVFGTGHSHMLAEELFYRAGGLACVNPILEEGLMLHRSAVQSTELERLEGLASIILKQQSPQEGDVIIIASNSGRNAVNIEMALAAKASGLKVIAITSLNHAGASSSRHSSGKRLHEVSDVVIDNYGCIGDASVEIPGLPIKVSPTSTVLGACIANAIVAEVVMLLMKRGFTPELFASSNMDGGDEHNRRLLAKYKGVVRSL